MSNDELRQREETAAEHVRNVNALQEEVASLRAELQKIYDIAKAALADYEAACKVSAD